MGILRYNMDVPQRDGSDDLTVTIKELLNSFPGTEEKIHFGTLSKEYGIGMFPTSQAAIISEKEDITGHVEQRCAYPFLVVSRAAGLSEARKEKVKEWLDTLGKWLERQNIRIGENEFKLKEYPDLPGDMRFEKFQRTSQAALYGTSEDKVEDWAIAIQATYLVEFDR